MRGGAEMGTVGPGTEPGNGGREGEARGATGDTGLAPTERSTCEALSRGADLRVEDVQGGVSIVAQPKGDTTLATVRDDARRVVWMAREVAAPASHSEACGLIWLARLPGVASTITEGPASVRIIMTTQSPGELRELRARVRDQVNALGRAR